MPLISLIPLFLLWVVLLFPVAPRAEVTSAYEADYASAVLAYRDRKYDEAVRILSELLGKAPETVEFLELKALSLKAQKKTSESGDVYKQLIQAKLKAKAPKEEIAPYTFELASIRFVEKNYTVAKELFATSIRYDFNVSPSHFFLGNIAYTEANWSLADYHFKKVLRSDVLELRPPARFYLSQVYMKIGYSTGALRNLMEAKEESDEILSNSDSLPSTRKVATQIKGISEKALSALDKGQYFASLSVLAGYDSNVLSLPSTTPELQATGKESTQGTLQMSAGYMSSPMRKFQFVPSYRNSYNYNFNDKSKNAEYFSNFLSLYSTYLPLARFNLGLKAELSYVMQNQAKDPDRNKWAGYNQGISAGPYFKYELIPHLDLKLETSIGKQTYPGDKDVMDSQKRSGTLSSARLRAEYDTGRPFFNPSGSVSYTKSNTQGSDFRSTTIGVDFTNTMYLTRDLDVTLTPSYASASYPLLSPVARKDQTYTFDAAASYKWDRKFTLLGDGKYIYNSSNLPDSFKFNRFSFTAGVSYSL